MIEKNSKFLRLYNGNIQILDKKNKKISEIYFETYDLNLAPYTKKESTHIYADELKTSVIIQRIKNNNYNNQQFAELNNRLINPIYIFCLSLLPLLVFKLSRRPDKNWLIPIIIVSVFGFVIKILEITMANLLIENNSFYLFNYFVPLGVTVLIFFLLYRENYKLDRIENVL